MMEPDTASQKATAWRRSAPKPGPGLKANRIALKRTPDRVSSPSAPRFPTATR